MGKKQFYFLGSRGGQESSYFPLQQYQLDWLQSLKQFFVNVSYLMIVANQTLMALF